MLYLFRHIRKYLVFTIYDILEHKSIPIDIILECVPTNTFAHFILFQYNDNNGNVYSDVYWLSAMVQAIGELEFGQQVCMHVYLLIEYEKCYVDTCCDELPISMTGSLSYHLCYMCITCLTRKKYLYYCSRSTWHE